MRFGPAFQQLLALQPFNLNLSTSFERILQLHIVCFYRTKMWEWRGISFILFHYGSSGWTCTIIWFSGLHLGGGLLCCWGEMWNMEEVNRDGQRMCMVLHHAISSTAFCICFATHKIDKAHAFWAAQDVTEGAIEQNSALRTLLLLTSNQ